MPFFWPAGATIPTWTSATAWSSPMVSTPLYTSATASNTIYTTALATAQTTSVTSPIWQNWTVFGNDAATARELSIWTDHHNHQFYQSQLLNRQAMQYLQDQQRAYAWGMGQPAAPAIITREQEARREQEAYRRAVEEHDAQEIARIGRLIEQREQSAAARRQQIEQAAEAQRQESQRRAAAAERARGLLLEHLTPEQRETFNGNGWFVVQGGRSGTKYRIRGGTLTGNVDVLHGDKVRHRLCAHVAHHRGLPMGDQLLAQKIMLELAEDDFLRTANRHAA